MFSQYYRIKTPNNAIFSYFFTQIDKGINCFLRQGRRGLEVSRIPSCGILKINSLIRTYNQINPEKRIRQFSNVDNLKDALLDPELRVILGGLVTTYKMGKTVSDLKKRYPNLLKLLINTVKKEVNEILYCSIV